MRSRGGGCVVPGRWGVVWIRAAERGGGACNRNPGLESDKLSRAAAEQQSSSTLQDLRFGRRDGRGRGGQNQSGSEKLGRTVNRSSGRASGWQLSCRVVVVSVVDRFRGILVPLLGANGTSSDWYCGLAGRGRGAGKRAAGHGTEAATRTEEGAACGSCFPAVPARKEKERKKKIV